MKPKQTPKTDGKVKAVLKRFTTDANGRVHLDLTGMIPQHLVGDLTAQPELYFKGQPKITIDDTKSPFQVMMLCKIGFHKALVDGQKDPGHIACLLNTRFTDYGMDLFFHDLFKLWKQYLTKKAERREFHEQINRQKLFNPGGQTDAQIHKEISADMNRRITPRSMAADMRELRSPSEKV